MSQPNFIIIYCDDLGYGDLSSYGSKTVKTPHLDELASTGIRFTDWYSNSPVCSPSRASLLTGQYPARTGVDNIIAGERGAKGLPEKSKTLATRLKDVGYKTSIFGKWHLGSRRENLPNNHGFDNFFGFHSGVVDYYSHINYWILRKGRNPVHDLWKNEKEIWENGSYITDLITKKSVDYIHNQKDSPFFLYVPFNAPHFPLHAPDKYLDRFSNLAGDKQIMAAMISAIDDGVGEIIKALKETNQYNNTVVFFSSDNGPSSESRNWLDGTEDYYYGGDAGLFNGYKGSLYEGGIREPAIISYPGVIEGKQVCNYPFVMMDIVPTFLDLANVDSSKIIELDGKSILSAITSKETFNAQRKIFWEYDGQLAVREENWKLVLNGKFDFDNADKDTIRLTNLKKDPGEKENLVEMYPNIANRLKKSVESWYGKIKNEQIHN